MRLPGALFLARKSDGGCVRVRVFYQSQKRAKNYVAWAVWFGRPAPRIKCSVPAKR